jgi:putative phosphoribosyl transferase
MDRVGTIRPTQTQKFDVKISSTQLDVVLDGVLLLPENPVGFVLFAHGSGSSKRSSRNQKVAEFLAQFKIASLLFDLLSEEESNDRRNVFNISLLTNRLVGAFHWLQFQTYSDGKPIGFFGASTGGAAALMAAAQLKDSIVAVVSRGGRPDLVPNSQLLKIKCPVLLLVGELDEPVINCNRKSMALVSNAKISIVPGASHLFEEEGTLEKMAMEAASWFVKCFQDKKLETMIHLQ